VALDTFVKEKLMDLGADTYIELVKYLKVHKDLDKNFLLIGLILCRDGLPTTAQQQSLKNGEVLLCVITKELAQEALGSKPCVYARIAGPVEEVRKEDQSVRL
jgi:hypothetical protein